MNRKFIKAVYKAEERTMLAFTDNGRCIIFEVYTQKDYDEYVTLENLTEYLKECGDLPEEFESYEEYAKDVWNCDEAEGFLLDPSCSDQWNEICELACIDPEEFPYSSWSGNFPSSAFLPTKKCAVCGKETTSGFLFDDSTCFCSKECATKFFDNDEGCVDILIDDGDRLVWHDSF